MGGLCNTLYDTLRPYIIHINHLETLAELCTILKIEMLEEHVNSNRKCNVHLNIIIFAVQNIVFIRSPKSILINLRSHFFVSVLI